MPKHWAAPDKKSSKWAAPKSDRKPGEAKRPAAFGKATYDRKGLFGSEIHTEGRAAGKESRKHKK